MNKGKLNSYDLSRDWFDWSRENPEKIKSGHCALYFYCIDLCNRLGWKDKFGLSTDHAKEATGIRNYKTYASVLNDLVDFGFLKLVEKSKNQYTANMVALVKTDKAHTKAQSKAKHKQQPKQVQSNVSIDKPKNINKTIKTYTKQQNGEKETDKSVRDKFDFFRKQYPGTKNGLEIELSDFLKCNKPEAVDLLLPALEKEIQYRKRLTEIKQFNPQWKHLCTWINKKCWEQDFAEPVSLTSVSQLPVNDKIYQEPESW
jgi:hypothetical protein